MSGTSSVGPAGAGGDPGWTLDCECGYVARGEDEATLVRDARRHALEVHRLVLSPEQILRGVGGSVRAPGRESRAP